MAKTIVEIINTANPTHRASFPPFPMREKYGTGSGPGIVGGGFHPLNDGFGEGGTATLAMLAVTGQGQIVNAIGEP